MKLDDDLRNMSAGRARQELQRVRQLVRTHRDAKNNARCWHNDDQLYRRVLPEEGSPGRMQGSKVELLKNCGRYIDRQQCEGRGCTGTQGE